MQKCCGWSAHSRPPKKGGGELTAIQTLVWSLNALRNSSWMSFALFCPAIPAKKL